MEAGDFVRFLTDYSETNGVKDTALSGNTDAGKVISAVALSENKVFIAWNSQSVCGVVCTISGTTISVGTPVSMYSTFNTNTISLVALSENKIFIAYSYTSNNSSSTDYLCGIVCTIDGNVVTKGTHTILSSTSNTGKTISAVKLDEGKVFIAHSYGDDYYLYGMVCTISGTTITAGKDTFFSSLSYSGKVISAVALSDSKVFIAHSNSSIYYYVKAIVCTISGTTISKGTDTSLNSTSDTGKAISAVKLDEGKVFIAHSSPNNSSNTYLSGIVCIISGTTITAGTDTLISSVLQSGFIMSGDIISAVKLNKEKVFVAHRSAGSYKLYGIICTVNGATITSGTDIELSSVMNTGNTISVVALSENNIFIGHSYGSTCDLYGMVIGYLANLVKTITSSTEEINGIALTSGQAGEMVTVKKPDETFVCSFNASVTAGGNSINWNNVVLSHRKVLDGSTKVYSPTKNLIIDGTVYEFKFFIYYKEDTAGVFWTGWKFGWEYSPKLYTSGATVPSNEYSYASPITKTATRTAEVYTNELSEGVEVTFSETENPINIPNV